MYNFPGSRYWTKYLFFWRFYEKNSPLSISKFSECGKWTLSSSLAAKLAGETGDNFVADEERWPSLSYLVHVKDKSTCTASIIGPRWVVAAHSCITKR